MNVTGFSFFRKVRFISSASNQSSCQCLTYIKIDKDFTHSYLASFSICPCNEKETQPNFYRGMPQASHAINCRRNNHSIIINYAAPCDWRYLSMPI